MSGKIDFKLELKHLYRAPTRAPVIVDVPDMRFLMVDGRGDPNTSRAYAEAVEALFSVSYAAKFIVKKAVGGIDYGVMPLEGLWWSDDPEVFLRNERAAWQWTMMIMQPEPVSDAVFEQALDSVKRRKSLPTIESDALRFASFHEGPAAQMMHVGPFSQEGPAIAQLHGFIAENGHGLAGKHHEIYLSDIRKADPSRWKTVLRQPFR